MNDEPQHKHRKYWLFCLFAVFIAILGVVLPETEYTAKQYINASNITVVGAASTQGSLQNLTDINQGYYNISESTGPFSAVINFTNVTNFSFLEVKAKYFSITGTPSTHIVDLEIYCTTDNEYEDVFFMENSVDWRYFTRHFPDTTHFINAQGNVSIKFNHTSNGNTNHRLWIDVARLITSVQYEQNIIYQNNYYNTTTGGSGAANLSQLLIDVNKSWNGYNIYNVSIDNQSMSGKLNTSGGNMTGVLYSFANGSLSGSYNDYSQIVLNHWNNTRFNSSGVLNDAQGTGVNYMLQLLSDGNFPAQNFFAITNNTGAGTFYGIKSRGNASLRLPILLNDFIFIISGRGVYAQTNNSDLTASLSAGRVYIGFQTNENWGSTNQGTKIVFGTTPIGTTSTSNTVTVVNGTITGSGLTGTGSAVAQVDSTGRLYANHSAGSGITLKSPDGNSWCVQVNNAGTLVANSGACT